MTAVGSNISLILLDPVKGHAIQTWEFNERPLIRIGRGDTNDVVIGDPVVSRVHVELVARPDGQWGIVSLGRNGTWVDGEPAAETTRMRNGTVMQLGSNGPSVEFRQGHHERASGETLVGVNMSSMAMLQVDEAKMQAEVSRIAEGDLFKNLQKQALEMRKAREEKDPH
jgi:hypothetical protein